MTDVRQLSDTESGTKVYKSIALINILFISIYSPKQNDVKLDFPGETDRTLSIVAV